MTTTTTARALLRAWFDFTAPAADRTAARLALADLAEESRLDGATIRNHPSGATFGVIAAMNALLPRVGRKGAGNALADALKHATAAAYDRRRLHEVNPEGTFDGRGRWYPSDREEAGDVRGAVRAPSAAWPYSYTLRCRTREHCAALVWRALGGIDVPDDVTFAATPARALLASLLAE